MAYAILDNGTKKLQVVLGGAVNTNECPLTVQYAEIKKDGNGDEKSASFQSTDSITTGNTAVDVLTGAPTGWRRSLQGFSLHNADLAQVTVTVQLYVTASVTRKIISCQLQTLESLHYSEAQGWFAVDVNGNRKTNSPASSGASSTADSKAVLASSQASSIQLSVASTSSQASSIALLVPASISSQASSMVALVPASVSSQASSVAALNPNTVSSLQSGASVQSFTSTTWSTVSSATSRVKSSFTW